MKFTFKKTYIALIALILIEILLFWKNYVPGTFLVGWDNVYPELNIANNIKMNLFSIWQEYRGLGAPDTMAHAANILHTLFLALLKSFLPLNSLRYVFHFLAHLLGGIGMYFLLRKQFKKNELLSFTGALFYQFNMATIQMFYAPFEAFSAHFAAIPWLLYSLLSVIKKPSRKNVILFFVVSFIATPQSLIPTLFIAYGILIASVLFVDFIKYKQHFLKKFLLVSTITIVTNAFWLFPFIHSALTQGKIVAQTKINELSSQIIFERNKNRGSAIDVLLMRSFMLDTAEDDLKNNHVYIMQDWISYINNPAILTLSLLISGTLIIGFLKVFYDFVKKKNETSLEIYILPAFIFSFFILGNDIPILGSVSSFFRDNVPLFGEAFRFPFTKFAIVYGATFTILFIKALEFLLEHYKNKKIYLASFCLPLIILIYSFPSFTGHFFYSVERLQIPSDYFKVIDYFSHEPTDRRIMTLPQISFWNWLYYTWGERGSGFAWYGIPQAQLERPFDPWSNYNEQYINEALYALQTNDQKLFKNVIEKYDISYILIDEYIQHINKLQQKDKLIEFIKNVYPTAQTISFKKMTIVKLPQKPYITLKENPKVIGSKYNYEYKDQMYEENGNYYYGNNWDEFYLTPSLFTNKTQNDLEFDFSVQKDKIIFTPHDSISLPDSNSVYKLTLDKDDDDESTLIPLIISINNNEVNIKSVPISVQLNNSTYTMASTKDYIYKATKDQITSISINDEIIPIGGPVIRYFYSSIPNTIVLNFNKGSQERISYTPISNLVPKITLPATTKDIQQTISLPIIHPDKFNYGNIFEAKTYQIEAPCKEEIHTVRSGYDENNNSITLSAQNSAVCFHQFLDSVDQTLGFYIYLNIDTLNPEAIPLQSIIDNPQTKTNVIETQLDGVQNEKLLVVPPTNKYLYENYGFHLRNLSVSDQITTNKINEMSIGYLPVNQIKALKIVRNTENDKIQKTININYNHPFQIEYSLAFPESISNDTLLYLSQSYNPDWKAYIIPNGNSITKLLPFLFGTEIKNHVLTNNWANGWILSEDQKTNSSKDAIIIIIFWPYYLQLIGYIILIGAILFYPSLPFSRKQN